MEKRLRIKFIGVAMLAVTIVLACMIGAINGINYYNVCASADARLALLAQNNGAFPEGMGLDSASLRQADEGSPSANSAPDAPKQEEGALKNSDGSSAGSAGAVDAGGAGAVDAGDAGGAGSSGGSQSAEKGRFGLDSGHGMSAETPFESRYFTVTLTSDGSLVAEDVNQIASVTADQALEYAQGVMKGGGHSGFAQQYRFATSSLENGQTMYLFLDCSRDLGNFQSFLTASILISIVGWLLVLILVVLLSRIVIRPIVESYAKQKAFVTDASHEIKTPLAVISAANEVQEMENGETEWSRSISEQVQRLSTLTERLVMLARMDEGKGYDLQPVNLTEVVRSAAEPFEAVAQQRGKVLVQQLDADVECKGDSAAISQVVELLLDNAMRYSSEGSQVCVRVYQHGRKAELSVSNQVDQMPKGNLDKLFERFYRDDSSRSSKTGGTGVGLSVVRSIAEAHGGSAHANAQGNVITFTVRLQA